MNFTFYFPNRIIFIPVQSFLTRRVCFYLGIPLYKHLNLVTDVKGANFKITIWDCYPLFMLWTYSILTSTADELRLAISFQIFIQININIYFLIMNLKPNIL